MGGTKESLAVKFAPHHLPVLLAALADYWDEHPVYFSGSFEVSEDKWDGVREWFRNNEAGYSRVRVFGHDGIDGLFCLWFYEGRTPETAPVIYLGGEGEGTTVLADTFAEFLSILAANRDWEPFDGDFTEPEQNNADENVAFRRFLAGHRIKPARAPMTLVREARRKHPDLDEWLATVRPGWR